MVEWMNDFFMMKLINCCLNFYFMKNLAKISDQIVYFSAFNIALLIVAALCFRSMKRDILENMRLNAVYSTTPTEVKETNAKCNLLKISDKRNENDGT